MSAQDDARAIASDDLKFKLYVSETLGSVKTSVEDLKVSQQRVTEWLENPETHCSLGRTVLHQLKSMKQKTVVANGKNRREAVRMTGTAAGGGAFMFGMIRVLDWVIQKVAGQ
ncbi:MAG TPA: hypothetical protein VMW24_26960 [Sedimentisphaerales bacterium]|nr:hypothetical protein [Sedimentisphaerales bacterium]